MFSNLRIGVVRPIQFKKDHYIQTIEANGGTVAILPEDDPHFCISSTSGNARKAKLFKHAASSKLPIVSEDYFADCLKQKVLLPTDEYAIENTKPVALSFTSSTPQQPADQIDDASPTKPSSPQPQVEEEVEPQVEEEVPFVPLILLTPLAKNSISTDELNFLQSKAKLSTRYSESPACVISTQQDAQRSRPLAMITKATSNMIPIVSTKYVTDSMAANQLLVIFDGDYDLFPKSALFQQPPKKKSRTLSPLLYESIPDEVMQLDKEATETSISTLAKSLLSPPVSPRRSKTKKMKKIDVKPELEFTRSVPNCTVYVDDELNYWTTSLNQTNVAQNNNKFYIIQLLVASDGKFFLACKWGRVGAKSPQKSLKQFSDLGQVKSAFNSQFQKKTGNAWMSPFVPKLGKYAIVEVDYTRSDDEEDVQPAETVDQSETSSPKSSGPLIKLPTALDSFIKFIFDSNFYREAQEQMGYSSDKLPLGKLSASQIKKAYQILSTIQDVINAKASGDIQELTSQYYTTIPTNFGMKKPPLIRSDDHIGTLIKNLADLADMSIAQRLASAADKILSVTANVDKSVLQYRQLNTGLLRIDSTDHVYGLINQYVTTNHGPTHNDYHLTLIDCFKIDRPAERQRYDACPIKNKVLLFHGSRVTNAPGILSNGLKIAPPEAPATGYMFGKGVYLANMSSKSANYCCPVQGEHGSEGTLYLVEAKLGSPAVLSDAMYMEEPLPDSDSTWGQGRVVPDESSFVYYDDVLVPIGAPVSPEKKKHLVLNYDEFIVYDTDQVLLRYVVRVKFDKRKRR
ncbi:hypothetical protein GEMRC1_002804 [Eukaryota sp. GEM-RC1]